MAKERCGYITHVDAPYDVYRCEKPTDLKYNGDPICLACAKKEHEQALIRVERVQAKLAKAQREAGEIEAVILTAQSRKEEADKVKEEVKAVPQMTLGAMILALKAEPQENLIFFDFAGLVPTNLYSYRGVHTDLAIGVGDKGKPRVRQLLADLQNAVGATFTGYKGGDFEMSSTTLMWVANWGDANGTAIVGVTRGCIHTIINTAYKEL